MLLLTVLFFFFSLQGRGNLTSAARPDNKALVGDQVREVPVTVLCLPLFPWHLAVYLNPFSCPQTKSGTRHIAEKQPSHPHMVKHEQVTAKHYLG